METAANSPEAIPQKTSAEIIRFYVEAIEKYLRPPYTFDLPPTSNKLMPDYPGYKYFMCRRGLIQPAANDIERAAADKRIELGADEREDLKISAEVILDIVRSTRPKENRTKRDMVIIRAAIRNVANILKNAAKRAEIGATPEEALPVEE